MRARLWCMCCVCCATAYIMAIGLYQCDALDRRIASRVKQLIDIQFCMRVCAYMRELVCVYVRDCELASVCACVCTCVHNTTRLPGRRPTQEDRHTLVSPCGLGDGVVPQGVFAVYDGHLGADASQHAADALHVCYCTKVPVVLHPHACVVTPHARMSCCSIPTRVLWASTGCIHVTTVLLQCTILYAMTLEQPQYTDMRCYDIIMMTVLWECTIL